MHKIKKTDVIAHMMTSQDLDYESVNNFLDELGKYIKSEIAKGNSIYFYKFGVFNAQKRKAQKGHNPITGEPMIHPAHYVPKFRPSSNFRDLTRKLK